MSNITVISILVLSFAALTLIGTIAYVLVRWKQTGRPLQGLWEIFGGDDTEAESEG